MSQARLITAEGGFSAPLYFHLPRRETLVEYGVSLKGNE